MAEDEEDYDTFPPVAAAERTAAPNISSENDQSYTEFYARLGTEEEELAVAPTSASTAASGQNEESRPSASSSQDLEASLLSRDQDSSRIIARTGVRAQCSNLSTIIVIAVSFLITVVLLWWLSGGSKNLNPPDWHPADAYEVSFVMTLESLMEEPGIAMVDSKRKTMRVSYYSGMTTYILNETGPSWSIVPRIDRLTCFEESNGIPLQAIFPDMKRFRYARQRDITLKPRGAKATTSSSKDEDASNKKKKNRVTCDEWSYRADNNSEGYFGVYTLWTLSGANNVPVRFSFVGHNVILGSSHYDNYTIDYYNYRELTSEGGVDPFWLRPPRGMPCINITDDSAGPTLASQHVKTWKMLFPEANQERQDAYEKFYATHSKKEKSAARSALFHQTLRLVEAHNRDASKSYQLGINYMADWTREERRSFARGGLKAELRLQDKIPKSTCTVQKLSDLLSEYTSVKLPNELNYALTGLALPPGEQGTCGSCWAFATTGAIEGQIAKKTEKAPVGLSEQNLMDCSWLDPYDNFACNGGLDYTAYAWAMEHNNGTIATEHSYPFLNQDGFCHYDLKRGLVSDGAHADHGVPRITECFHVTEAFLNSSTLDKSDLVKAFNLRLNSVGPLAVSIDATPDDFYFYKGGVYHNPACKSGSDDLDHAVLAIGYNLTGDMPYTIIRNNWGVWGEGGYARIAQKDNICGVATAATFVHVE